MIQNRSKIDLQAIPTAFGDANGVASVLGTVPKPLGACLGCPGKPFGQLLAALGSPGTAPDRLWGVIWASKSRPERVRTRSGNGLGRPSRPKIDFSSIFCRFWFYFRGFSIVFAWIFAETACDEDTESESQKGVARSSLRVLALALCSRFVLPVRLSKWLANVTCSAFFRCVPTSPPSIFNLVNTVLKIHGNRTS